MWKKLFIVFVILVLAVGFYYEKIIGVIDEYAYEHQDSDWAPKVEFTIGNFYYSIRHYDKAIEMYDWLLTFYKNKKLDLKGDVQYMLGRCYEKQGNVAKAETIYREILRVHPGTSLARKVRRRFMENEELDMLLVI